MEGLRALSEEIATEWRLGGVTHENEEAARRHLVNMLRIKAEAKKKRRSTTRRKPELPDRLRVTSTVADYYKSF